MTRAVALRRGTLARVTEALRSPGYRVTLTRGRQGINLTRRGPDRPERPIAGETLVAWHNRLAYFNATGWNLYLTPIDPAHYYLVIDDLPGQDGIAALQARGYRLALLQRTSPDNYQAVIKARRGDADPGIERRAANAWVRRINTELGDPRFSGAIHPFRLAGFTNRKPKHEGPDGRFPRVHVVDDRGGVCPQATAEIASGQVILTSALPVGRPRGGASPWRMERPTWDLLDAMRRFDLLRREVGAWVDSRGWVRDDSRIDFETARRMSREGFRMEEVAAVLQAGSPDLRRRHADTWGYAAMTVTRAFEAEAVGWGREDKR